MKQKPYLKVDTDVNGEVCITGNCSGLLWLARMCIALARNPEEGHIHLQNEGDTLDSNHQFCTLRLCSSLNFNRHSRQHVFYMVAVVVAIVALCVYMTVKYML